MNEAAPAAVHRPHQMATARLAHRSGHVERVHAGERGGDRDLELLAQHRADAEQPPRLVAEEGDAVGEDGGGPARGLDRGQRGRLDLPALRPEDERTRLDQAAQHGGGHERTALRQPGGDLERGVGHGPGHRRGQGGHVAVRER